MLKIKNFFTVLFSFITIPLFGGMVQERMKEVPLKEQFLMNEFVKLNFEWFQYSHVLFFDNKPISLASAFLKSPENSIRDLLWIEGLRSFKQYEYLFPHPNYIFSMNIFEEDEEGYQEMDLFIINKRSLAKCCTKHLMIFKKILGDQFSYEWLVSELKNKKLFQVIKKDQMLLGILLGYGKESSLAFKKHQDKNLEYFF